MTLFGNSPWGVIRSQDEVTVDWNGPKPVVTAFVREKRRFGYRHTDAQRPDNLWWWRQRLEDAVFSPGFPGGKRQEGLLPEALERPHSPADTWLQTSGPQECEEHALDVQSPPVHGTLYGSPKKPVQALRRRAVGGNLRPKKAVKVASSRDQS